MFTRTKPWLGSWGSMTSRYSKEQFRNLSNLYHIANSLHLIKTWPWGLMAYLPVIYGFEGGGNPGSRNVWTESPSLRFMVFIHLKSLTPAIPNSQHTTLPPSSWRKQRWTRGALLLASSFPLVFFYPVPLLSWHDRGRPLCWLWPASLEPVPPLHSQHHFVLIFIFCCVITMSFSLSFFNRFTPLSSLKAHPRSHHCQRKPPPIQTILYAPLFYSGFSQKQNQ